MSGNSLNSRPHPNSTSSMRWVRVCVFCVSCLYRLCCVFPVLCSDEYMLLLISWRRWRCWTAGNDMVRQVNKDKFAYTFMGNVPYRTQLDKWVSLPRAVVIVCYVLYTEGAPVMTTWLVFIFSLPDPLPGMCAYFNVLTFWHTPVWAACVVVPCTGPWLFGRRRGAPRCSRIELPLQCVWERQCLVPQLNLLANSQEYDQCSRLFRSRRRLRVGLVWRRNLGMLLYGLWCPGR